MSNYVDSTAGTVELPESSRPAQSGWIRLPLYFFVGWVFSLLTGVGVFISLLAGVEVDTVATHSLRSAVAGLLITVGAHAMGSFVLGVLMGQRARPWRDAIIFVAPNVLVRAATFVWAAYDGDVAEELLSQPMYLIVLPIVGIVIALVVVRWFIGVGQGIAPRFAHPNALFDVPWYQAVWVVPASLIQIVGVPAFLLLTLWKVDLLSGSGFGLSFLHELPTLLVRVPILLLLFVTIALISNFYDSIRQEGGGASTVKAFVYGAVSWLLLTGLELVIALLALGNLQQLAD